MQFSLFGAAAATPSALDLDGVLLAGGRWARTGAAARLSVVVADRWRADALAGAFVERGVGEPIDPVGPAESGFTARTAFTAELGAAAARWTRGANEGPPPDFRLTAGGLRLWAICTGRRDEAGFVLGTAREESTQRAGGAALAALGLAAVSLTPRSGGPGWRITSARRLRRLGELLGDPPAGAGADWPLD